MRRRRGALLAAALLVAAAGAARGQEEATLPPEGAPAAEAATRAEEVRPATTLRLAPRGAVLAGSPLHLDLHVEAPPGERVPVAIRLDGREIDRRELAAGEHEITLDAARPPAGGRVLTATSPGVETAELRVRAIPGWLSVVPPLVAIGLALAFKDVLLSLFLGVFSGALILAGGDPFTAFARTVDGYVLPALANRDHAAILIFSTLLGGMVGVISKSGGTRGIVERLRPYATTARRGQVATWLMGVLIFFDDYANTLIVGSTMRPVTDRLRISREKLAYIVDSTAAPVASVVPISTWIGFEVGLIAAAFTQLDLPFNAYTTLVDSILFRFYPIFALVLGFSIAFTCRDFGPMLAAERRTSETGKVTGDDATPLADFGDRRLEPPDGAPLRAVNALLPIGTVIAVTLGGLWVSGSAGVERAELPSTFTWVREVFSAADPFAALLWASLAGLVVGLALAVGQRILRVREGMEAMVEGFKSMLLALVVLLLAWSVGEVCDALHTADYVVGLARGILSPHLLPLVTFLVSALVSFATGTSWATMAILVPLVIPITHGLALGAGYGVESEAFYVFIVGAISSVLAGSVWGDHCSPISDTTILSSMASGCDHIAHVRTQIPYALAIGVLGMLVGDLPTAYGMSPWISLAVGSVVIVGTVAWLGKRSDWSGARR